MTVRTKTSNAVLTVLCCLIALSPAWSVSPRVAVCTPAKTAPVIDGKLDDACWQTAGVVTDFLLDSGKGLASDPAEARLCFDRNNLYIGVTCFESDMGRIKAARTEADTDVSSDDDVEIFFDGNEDRRTFHHFMFNTLGTKTEMLNGGAEWDCDWTVKIAKGRDRWSAEVSIPLKVLGGAALGKTWGFNIGRGQAGAREYASFAGIKGKWASPGGFATLKFAANDDGAGRIFRDRSGFQTFALHPQQALDLLKLPAPDAEYLGAFGTPGETVPYTFHVFNLERKKSLTAKITATPFAGPAGKIVVPKAAFLYLYPRIAGSYAWEFLGEGDTVTVQPGQRGGFWLDLTVPDDAKAGIYRSTVTLAVNGKVQTRTVKLLVLPFKLDANPASCGFHTPKDRDARMLAESMRLMRAHGMTTFAPYGGWGGPRGVAEYVRLRKAFGFKGKTIYADGCMYVGDRLARGMNLPKRGPKSLQKGRCWVMNDEYKRRYVADMKKYYDAAVAAGYPQMSFSIGDELTNDGYDAAMHSVERAKVLREGIPKMELTTDTNGYTEAVGCSKYLNCVGVNDGWDGPDNHNGGKRILTRPIMKEITDNRCGIEFVNTGTDRFPFGFYLWRMTAWGVRSKIEWIWDSSRMQPAWLNVYRETVRDGKPTGVRIDRYRPPAEWKTFVTVALKFSRAGTYDSQYAATLANLVKRIPDPAAKGLLDDITAAIPIPLAESRGSGWSAARCDVVRWELAKHIMRLKGQPVGVDTTPRTNLGDLAVDPSSKWTAAKLQKKFIRHKSRTFACAKVAAAPKLDGKPDDAAWKQAEVITGAYDDRDISLIESGFEVRTVHTDDGVYLSVESNEPRPEKIATSTKGNDDPGLWKIDDIEIFIDPGKTGEYYHLAYDAKGTKSDWKKTEITWNGRWQVACALKGKEWTSEVFLPFATFGGKDKPWALFVGRGSPTRGQYFGITPIQGSWHSVNQFGTLEFKPAGPHIAKVGFGRVQAGSSEVGVIPYCPPGQVVALTAEAVTADGQTCTLKPVARPGRNEAGILAGEVPLKAGTQELTLHLKGPGGRMLDVETFVLQVPPVLSLTLDQASLFSDDLKRSARVVANIPWTSLELELTGIGVLKKVTVPKSVEGNQIDLTLKLPDLREGKYKLTATLKSNGKTLAIESTDFFVTRGPTVAKR